MYVITAFKPQPSICFWNGPLHYLHFAWKLVKASVEAFTASMEASMEDIEAFMELPWKIWKI